MNQLKFHKNELQIDYFNESFQRFETDFYRYSTLDTPLTFLTDDIMLSRAKSGKCYFKLNKQNSRDGREHYYLFKIETLKESKLTRKYVYLQTVGNIK